MILIKKGIDSFFNNGLINVKDDKEYFALIDELDEGYKNLNLNLKIYYNAVNEYSSANIKPPPPKYETINIEAFNEYTVLKLAWDKKEKKIFKRIYI